MSEGNQTIEATIKSVSSHVVNKKDGSGQIKLYDIELDNGNKYTTKFRQQAEEAYNLVGRCAKLSVKVAQNGDFTNRYLQAVLGEVFQPSHPAIEQPSFDTVEAAATQPGKSGAEKDASIHRQCATKVAAAMHEQGDSIADFRANVADLIHFYETGQWQGESFHNPQPADDGIPF